MTVIENKLIPFYLWETIAHNLMLVKQGIVPKTSGVKILRALMKLKNVADKEKLLIDPSIGDVHENVESLLKNELGKEAGWFHTARSRNDQSATDQKLFTKKYLLMLFQELINLELVFLSKSEEHLLDVIPGYTHLRPAMPSTFGFWWQAYLDQVLSLHESLQKIYEVIDKNPLGAGSSYGVNWPIDTKFTTSRLGFGAPMVNALSAINARGIDDLLVISNLAVLHVVFSRMMEDLIIWSMPEVALVEISEEYTTGSSIMPQKMNPDVAEKIRSKTAKIVGNLMHNITAMKATPSGYNRDSSESKIAIVDTLTESLRTIDILVEMSTKIRLNKQFKNRSIEDTLYTKLADKLVEKYKIPFRSSHKIVGKLIGSKKPITMNLLASVLKEEIDLEIDVAKEMSFLKDFVNIDKALDLYSYEGTPNPTYVKKVNGKLKKKIEHFEKWILIESKNFYQAEKELYKEVGEFCARH